MVKKKLMTGVDGVPEAETKKPWYKSKTLWTNTLAIVGGLALWAQGEVATGATITVAGVVNAVLRLITEKKISF